MMNHKYRTDPVQNWPHIEFEFQRIVDRLPDPSESWIAHLRRNVPDPRRHSNVGQIGHIQHPTRNKVAAALSYANRIDCPCIPVQLDPFIAGVKHMNSLPKEFLWPLRYASALLATPPPPVDSQVPKRFKAGVEALAKKYGYSDTSLNEMAVEIKQDAGKTNV